MKFPLLASIYILIVLALTGCDDSHKSIRGLEIVDTAPPVFTSGITASASENSNSANYIVTANDVDEGEALSYSITGGSDAGLFNIDAGTGVLSFITPPNFENPVDSNNDNVYEVVVTASDSFNDVSQAVSISVTNVDEPPYFTSATAFSLSENVITGYTATAMDDAGSTLTFGKTGGGADQGAFSIDPGTGVLNFVSAPDFENPADSDGNNTYIVEIFVSDGTTSVFQTVTATVTDTNDNAPFFTSGTFITVAENTTITGYTATASDADAGSFFSFSVTGGVDQAAFSINSASGALSFNDTPDFESPTDATAPSNTYEVDISVTDGVNQSTQAVTVTVQNSNDSAPVFGNGNVVSINVDENTSVIGYTAPATDPDGDSLSFNITGGSELAAFNINSVTGELSFKVAADFETPADSNNNNTYVVDITVDDGLNSATQTVTVTVNNLNDNNPVFTSATSINTPENTSITGYTATAADADGDALSFSLTGGVDQSFFGIDGGSGVLSFNAPQDFENPADDGVDNTYIVEITASDGINQVAQLVTVNITNVVGSPVFTSGTAVSVNENTVATGYTATATDDEGEALTFDLVGGTELAFFTIDSITGVLDFSGGTPDYENPVDDGGDNTYVVDIRVTDSSMSSAIQTVTVTVLNANDNNPVFTSGTAISVDENTAVSFYTATATDVDGDSLGFSLGGDDQAAFNLDAVSGELTFNPPADYENPTDSGLNNIYAVDITADDGLNNTTQTVIVTVNNIIGIPTFTSGNAASVGENNLLTGYTATAIDEDGDFLTFSLTGGSDPGAFSIDEISGVLSFITPPDFENPTDIGTNNTYVVDITVTDGVNSSVQTVTITVTDVTSGVPVFTSGSAISVDENNTATGYTATATDEDVGSTLTFSLTGGADQAAFSIDPNTGVLSFVSASDFENPLDSGGDNIYDVNITVTDGITPVTQTVAVTVLNVQETPVFTSGTTIDVSENTTITGYTATATDGDNDTLSYSLTGGSDQSAFTIDSSTGVLSFLSAQNFEIPGDSNADNIFVVDINVTDGNTPVTQTVTVNVMNVQEAPVFTSGTAVSVGEGSTATDYIATATDEESDSLTFSLSGTDQDDLSIDPGTGELTFNLVTNFDLPVDSDTNNTYIVDITVTDGTTPVTQTVTVTVTNLSIAPPVFTSGVTASVTEGLTATGYTATATDADGDALSFSLTGGTDQAAFSINASSGELSFVIVTDFNNPADSNGNNDYVVEITVTDGTYPVTQTVTVSVTKAQVAPVFTSGTTISVGENNLLTGYTATATDADGDPLIYSLTGGSDQSAFSIDASTGVLSFNSAPDFENPGDSNGDNIYVVDISVTDSINAPVTLTLTVTVTDSTSGAPIFTSSLTLSIVENNTIAGVITATDENSQDNSLKFAITGGNDQGFFTLNGNETLSFITAPDFENPLDFGGDNIYEVEITVSDRTNDVPQTFFITVLDELEIIGSTPGIKTIQFDWLAYSGATYYRLLVNPDGASGYSLVPGQNNIVGTTTTFEVSVHLTDWVNATYILEAYDGSGKITESSPTSITSLLNTTSGYFKASNAGASDEFGYSVSLSGDGNTMAVGAPYEDTTASNSGMAYVFVRSGSTWVLQQSGKHGDITADDHFGFSVSLSEDGNTLAVGANGKNNSAGAAYIFSRSDSTWTQEAKIIASNTASNDEFGFSLSLSDDGNTLAVGAPFEDSSANGVSTDGTGESNNSDSRAGAAYIYSRSGGTWPQQAYVKASNSSSTDQFGWSISLSGDGNTLAVGANYEDHNNGLFQDAEGAAYVFTFSGAWSQQQLIRASDGTIDEEFGFSLSLSDDGNTLAVGAAYEENPRLLLPDQVYGAVYVYSRSGNSWNENAKKRINSPPLDALFGYSVSISGDGNTIVSGAVEESNGAGAVYVLSRSGNAWNQTNRMVAKNPASADNFGFAISISDDASIMAVGAPGEASNFTGISNDGTGESNNSSSRAGAVYIY